MFFTAIQNTLSDRSFLKFPSPTKVGALNERMLYLKKLR